jgi:hypothetical protein
MHKYGLPYRNAAGFIFPDDEDLVDLMLIAAEKYSDIHIVTQLNENEDYRMVNYFEPRNAEMFYLYTGNPDAEIEFTLEFRLDDWTHAQLEEGRRIYNELSSRPLTQLQIAAVNFSIQTKITKDCG